MNNLPKHVHIIGIAGVATSALAIAFHKAGVKVTGSDKGFYPPVSTYLTEAGISYYAGWHPEKIEEGGKPDIIVAGGVGTSLSNPEVMYAKEKGIPLLSFAEALAKFIIKKDSVVVTGTWGKTTISSLLSFILLKADMNPSYFTGGLSLSHPTGALSNSDISVVEGDEYKIAIWDDRPKFDLYKPTHLLLTSVAWDHADLYPTEKSYFEVFEKLVKGIPASGLLLVNTDNEGVAKLFGDIDKTSIKPRIVKYGKTSSADYSYNNVQPSKSGLRFDITHKGKTISIASPMLGRFNAENITAAFAMASELGVPANKIVSVIADFKGIKRRFEKRFEGKVTVLDCHAPTPDKVASVLESIREVYDKKIIAVFEPNIGGRERATAEKYDDAFKDADIVVIPHLTKLKTPMINNTIINDQSRPMEGEELAKIVSRTHKDCRYMENDNNLVNFLISQVKKDDVIVFLGSHGFRGMIRLVPQ